MSQTESSSVSNKGFKRLGLAALKDVVHESSKQERILKFWGRIEGLVYCKFWIVLVQVQCKLTEKIPTDRGLSVFMDSFTYHWLIGTTRDSHYQMLLNFIGQNYKGSPNIFLGQKKNEEK